MAGVESDGLVDKLASNFGHFVSEEFVEHLPGGGSVGDSRVGLVFGNTDFGTSDDTKEALAEAPQQVEKQEDPTGNTEDAASTLRSFLGGKGEGSSQDIQGFFDRLGLGDSGDWNLEINADPNQKTGGAANTPAQPAADPTAPADTANGRVVQGRYMTINLDESYRQLDGLEVKGRTPKTGYSRDQFGQAWSDDVTVEGGHNGCDTRQDRLKTQLTDVVIKPGTNDCVVLTGKLDDPYTGKTIDFKRGKDTSRAIQLDHVVALSDSWQKGTQQWDEDTRRSFANDPFNLIAVDGPNNASKGDGDATTWQPPNKAFRCEYAAMQIRVKSTYGLWVTQAEHDALQANLDRC